MALGFIFVFLETSLPIEDAQMKSQTLFTFGHAPACFDRGGCLCACRGLRSFGGCENNGGKGPIEFAAGRSIRGLGLIVLLWFGAGMGSDPFARLKQKSTRITVSLATYLVLPVVLCIGLPALIAFLIYGGIAAPTGWRELPAPPATPPRKWLPLTRSRSSSARIRVPTIPVSPVPHPPVGSLLSNPKSA